MDRLLTILATITGIICMILYAHSDSQVRMLEQKIYEDSCHCVIQIQIRDSINEDNIQINNALIQRMRYHVD